MIAEKESTEVADPGFGATVLARLLERGPWPQTTALSAGPFDRLGLVLGLLRELRKMNQNQLAAAAKIGKSQVSKYETGKCLPQLEILARILNALEISPLQLCYALELVESMAPAPKKQTPPARADFSRLFSVIPGTPEMSFTEICLGALSLYRAASLAVLCPSSSNSLGASA